MIAVSFRFGEQLPSLLLHAVHLAQQVITEPFLALLAGSDDGVGDVALVP
jgi:hypothetical protein